MIVGILFMLVVALMAVVQIALVVAALQTSAKLGIMAILLPMYVTSLGNHRLKTKHRRQLAAAWWAALIGLVVLMAVSSH